MPTAAILANHQYAKAAKRRANFEQRYNFGNKLIGDDEY
jgi:hypothetical protein